MASFFYPLPFLIFQYKYTSMKKLLYSIFLSTLGLTSFATNRFQTLYGDMETDRCRAFATTVDGYVLVGNNSFGATTADVTAYRIDNSGSLLWSAKIGTAKDDEATDIRETSDGGFIITGNTLGGTMDTAHTDIFVLKIDDQGFPIWSTTYGGQNQDEANCILVNPAGGYFVLGSTASYGNVDRSALLLKIDNNGIQQWTITCNATNINAFNNAILTPDGKIIAAGYALKNSGNDTDMLVVQIDTSGTINWAKRIGSTGNDKLNALCSFTGNGFLLAGSAGSNSGTDQDQNITCIENNGNIRWSRNWGKVLKDDRATSISTLGNGHLLVGGVVDLGNPSLRLYQMSLMDVDTLGNTNWAHTYGDPSVESESFASAAGINGGYACVGYSITSGDPNGDAYFVKTDNSGNSGCYELPLSLNTVAIFLSDSSGVDSQNLTIDENPEFFNWSGFINQFTQNCFYDNINSPLQNQAMVFPNPANESISLSLSKENSLIEIYNAFGQLTFKLSTNEEQISIPTSEWAAGIYLLSIDGISVQKLIVQH